MIPVVTPAEMAAIDAAAPEPVEVLIDRAGAALAWAARRLCGGTYGRRVNVVAGKGNNGADGRAAARTLRRWGVRVTVIDALAAPARLPAADLVIDAAYGTGFRGEYEAPDSGGAPVLAADIPSGVDGATGAVSPGSVRAAATVTFAALKPGLVLEPGRSHAGEVVVADIGLDVSSARAGVVESADVQTSLPRRPPDAHKWRAAVLVVAGSPGMTGAAELAASAAQRAGAGMVRIASPGATAASRFPTEAVAVDVPADGWGGAVLQHADRCHAVIIGPGLGRSDAAVAGVREVVARCPVPVVVDGDGLHALRGDAAISAVAPVVLTPHDGEFAHLRGAPPGADRFAAVRELAAATGAVVVLKGPTMLVCGADERVLVITEGDARLATAGTGDVLAGIIGALIARGATPAQAAAAGPWVHGRAAQLGPAAGFVASDLLHTIPPVLAILEAAR